MTARFGTWIAYALFGCMLALTAGGAEAQSPLQQVQEQGGAAADSVSAEQLERLVTTLEDPQARKELVDQINALIAARRQAEQRLESAGEGTIVSGLFEAISEQVEEINNRLTGVATLFSDLPGMVSGLQEAAVDPDLRSRWAERLVILAVLLAAALVAEAVAAFLVRRPAGAIATRAPAGWLLRIPLAILRLAIRLVPVAAFLALFYAGLSWAGAERLVTRIAVAVAHGYTALRVVMLLADTLLAPDCPALRLIPSGGETAHYAYVWVRRLALVIVVGIFGVEVIGVLGMPADGRVMLANLVGLVVAAMLVILVLQNRSDVSTAMRNFARNEGRAPTVGMLLNRLADVWHVLAILYIAAIFFVWVLDIEGGFEYVLRATVLSVIVLVAARIAAFFLQRALDRAFALNEDVRARYPSLERRANRYLPVLRTILTGFIVVVAALVVLRVWGVDSFAWLGTEAGRDLVGAAISIALVLVVALLLWEGISAALERYLSRLESSDALPRVARARTLVPMVRKVVLGVLVTIVALIVLSELGINIGPLLAGAGIIGIAVGFGAQKLVQDVITGGFLLIEDTVSVGDVVQAGSESGVVQEINIRTLVLRDLAGNVHTIPYSTVDRITNMTKDFSRYVFNVGVAYREDLDEVMKVLTELGAEMREDPEFGQFIRKDFEILGVDEFADSAIIIKARFETEPIKQWTVGREYNRRMKRRFDELGIEIPFPHQTLYFGVDKQGGAPPARVVLEGDARQVGGTNPDADEAGDVSLPRSAEPKDDNVGDANPT